VSADTFVMLVAKDALKELVAASIAPEISADVPTKYPWPVTKSNIWSPVAKLVLPFITADVLADTVGSTAVPPIDIVLASPLVTLSTVPVVWEKPSSVICWDELIKVVLLNRDPVAASIAPEISEAIWAEEESNPLGNVVVSAVEEVV